MGMAVLPPIRRILDHFQSHPRPESLGLDVRPGGDHYRAYVGPPEDYDLIAGMTFSLLAALGLRQHHHLLDIGCGSLRIGRLLIPYLNRGHYTGIEPNEWLIEEGIRSEIGQDQIRIKKPNLYIGDSTQILPAGEVYDFALAQSIFSHSGPDLVKSWLAGISSRLRGSGAFIASFAIGQTDNETKGWIYPECVFYRADTLARFSEEAGLRFILLDWAHPRLQWALFAKPDFKTDWLERHGLSWNSWLRSNYQPMR
jgi:SAM-dependent methyltransferase